MCATASRSNAPVWTFSAKSVMYSASVSYTHLIRFLCPFFAAIILLSSVANALGWISM